MSQADYVVVGAGSAGCALAARLAEAGHSVILLEGGKKDKSFFVKKPGMIAAMHSEPKLKKGFDWGYYTTPQENANNRRIPQTRGKVLGGSSSVNGMLWVRGNRANYDSWAAEGNTGWDADTVNDLYKRIEDFEGGENDYRGVGGPIKVQRHTQPTEASDLFLDACADTLGVKVLEDYNAAEQEGVSQFQQSIDKGLRYSTSRGYIHDQKPAGLDVRTRVHVNKVIINNGRATGVEITDKGGSTQVINAGKEVIVSAGVFGSPQILQLSGVGPADHLKKFGINVISDLPVGDNLQDHLLVPMTYQVDNSPHIGSPAYFAKGVAKEVIKGGTFLVNSVFEKVAFVRTSLATDVPDLQIHVLPWAYPSPNQDAPVRHEVDLVPALTVMSTLIYPRSRGTVRLASADPKAAPLIDFAYLREPEDRQTLVEGCQMIREIMANPIFGGHVKKELHPGNQYSNADLDTEIRDRATTVYHGVGSCRMGTDETAVVGPDLKVRGVDGLRVADASIMPSIIGGNTNAPSIMIGEKCADLILGNN